MEDPLTISLFVTGVGMLMLFVALGFLYGLMYLLTEYVTDRPEPQAEDQPTAGERPISESGRRTAAVIAVALARAEQAQSSPDTPEPSGGGRSASLWWMTHHQRQLAQNRPARRSR
jgi:Na+-transporting methylmalonyl-CoA/oxaloacetate decarboxylase gamma subunit